MFISTSVSARFHRREFFDSDAESRSHPIRIAGVVDDRPVRTDTTEVAGVAGVGRAEPPAILFAFFYTLSWALENVNYLRVCQL